MNLGEELSVAGRQRIPGQSDKLFGVWTMHSAPRFTAAFIRASAVYAS
jgi:hypothetical protein